jgi:hypothetical protein
MSVATHRPSREARVTNRRAYAIGPSAFAENQVANGKIVLALLFRNRKSEPRATPLQMPAARSQPSRQLGGPTSGPTKCSKPVYQNAVPKRRLKRVQIARLYPERPSEPSRQARALIDLIREECPEIVGLYVPKSDPERTYRELCAVKSWQTHH